jgi:GH25 family lysozyme M1 (1,4-beta-N-acetylmuramidase)
MPAFSANRLAAALCVLFHVTVFAARPLGIDVSTYQPDTSMDWPSIKSGGISFAWAKATEGATGNDNQYTAHMPNGKAAGIYMGSYHYAHPESNASSTEANHFWTRAATYTKNDGLSLNPMLDVEGAAFSGHVGTTTTTAWCNEWCNAIIASAAAQGVTLKPNIYVSACNACNFDSTISQWYCDIADYNGQNAQTSTPWTTCTSCERWGTGTGAWNFWQYSSTGGITGYANNIDKDVFNGTDTTLRSTQVIGGSGPQITNQPDSIVVGAGSDAVFTVGATGTSLTYKWRFNLTNIAGATANSYTVTNVSGANAGNYSVVVSNSTGATTSSFAYLSVTLPATNAADAILSPTNLVHWWEGQADTTDSFGTAVGTPHGNFYYAAGRPGYGFHFDGSSTYLTTGMSSLPVPWTLALWVYRQNAPGTSAALLSDGTYSFKLEQYNATRQVGITRFGVGDYTFGYVTPANAWTHLALVGTSTGTSLYVNGALQSSLTNSQPLPRAYMGASYVASTGVVLDYMLGTLDEVLVFNRALSASEISAIYGAGAAGLIRAPELTSIDINGNTVALNMRGIPGKPFTIYHSPDLINWTSLGRYNSPASTPGMLQFYDSAAGVPQYFYSLTQP